MYHVTKFLHARSVELSRAANVPLPNLIHIFEPAELLHGRRWRSWRARAKRPSAQTLPPPWGATTAPCHNPLAASSHPPPRHRRAPTWSASPRAHVAVVGSEGADDADARHLRCRQFDYKACLPTFHAFAACQDDQFLTGCQTLALATADDDGVRLVFDFQYNFQ